MTSPCVEIIMPAYNAEKTIEKSIQAIRDQSFKDWSLIVVNDASTDSTGIILDKYALLDSRITILNTDKNSGVSVARNTALNFIGGSSYVAYCDSDDVWEPNHLEISLAFLNLGADIVYNNPNFIDENQNKVFPNFPFYNNFNIDNLRKGNVIWISSVVHRGKIGLFDSELDSIEDYDLWIRAAKQGLKFKQHNNKTTTYLVKTSGMATKGAQTLNKLRAKHRDFVTLSGGKLKKYSIIIPTAFDHLESDLKPCLESIAKYTDLSDTEVIVVSNGATDNTDDYVRSLGEDYKLLTYPEALGYAKACNKGLEVAEGQYIILLNNDCILLEQPKNHWINILEEPFKYDPAAGVVGPLKGPSGPAGHDFLIFFCVMIKKELVAKLKLSEDYGVGGGEDTEYCIEAEKLGYKVIQFPSEKPTTSENERLMLGTFPIYHRGEATMNRLSNWKSVFDNNSLTLAKKYNPSWYKWKISNYCERAVIDNKENLASFPREVTRYKNAAKHIKKGDKVLEIGCSSGYGLRFFPEDILYTGVDYDETIIEYAKENFAGSNRTFIHCDIHNFEFKEHYDVIVAYEVIEHLSDGKEIAQKLKQHCNTLLISTPYKEIPGLWGPHHLIHHITEKDFPDFEYTFVSEDGRLIETPERFDGMNLLLMKWEKGKEYAPPVVAEQKNVHKGKILAFVPTKNRYGSLAMTIQSIALQTVRPDHLMIYDDGEGKDLRTDPVFKHIFRLLDMSFITWEVVFGKKKGQHHGHEMANSAGYEYVWRIDDDEIAEPDVLEILRRNIEYNPEIGAVGGSVIVPGEEQPGGKSKIEEIYHTPNIQWSRKNPGGEVDHLYSSFLYRAGITTYDLRLSPVAHREETLFSYSLKMKGYKLYFIPEAVTYHFRSETGGIRDGAKQEFFVNDEQIFKKELEKEGIKVVRENGGLGDNLIFRNNVLQPLLKKYKHVILGTCYTNVFQDIKASNMTLLPVGAIPEVPTDNIYAWAAYTKWNESFGEAYKKFYGVD